MLDSYNRRASGGAPPASAMLNMTNIDDEYAIHPNYHCSEQHVTHTPLCGLLITIPS